MFGSGQRGWRFRLVDGGSSRLISLTGWFDWGEHFFLLSRDSVENTRGFSGLRREFYPFKNNSKFIEASLKTRIVWTRKLYRTDDVEKSFQSVLRCRFKGKTLIFKATMDLIARKVFKRWNFYSFRLRNVLPLFQLAVNIKVDVRVVLEKNELTRLSK